MEGRRESKRRRSSTIGSWDCPVAEDKKQKTKNKTAFQKDQGLLESCCSLSVCVSAVVHSNGNGAGAAAHFSTYLFLPFRLLFTLSFSLSPFFSFLWLAGRSRRESSVRQRQWEIDILIYYTKGNRSRFFKNLTENNKKLVPHLKEEDSSRKWTFPYVTQVVSWVKFFFLPPTK
jgi:hypothetical protein